MNELVSYVKELNGIELYIGVVFVLSIGIFYTIRFLILNIDEAVGIKVKAKHKSFKEIGREYEGGRYVYTYSHIYEYRYGGIKRKASVISNSQAFLREMDLPVGLVFGYNTSFARKGAGIIDLLFA